MTLLLDRTIPGPKTHAFVIGVGSYPHAKLQRGVQESLRRVPDLPSAADSAKLMCDWLLSNQDKLVAPLATLEVLISEPAIPDDRYQWGEERPIDEASSISVRAAGQAWFGRLSEADSTAFFYCCGHGASHLQEPVLFLEDLNEQAANIWSHINVGLLAYALRKKPSVSAAFMFSDACGEFIKEFELNRYEQDCRFFNVSPVGGTHNRVSLLCAAAEAQLAYEGHDKPDSSLRFGRFTQALLKGLDGSSARWLQNRWSVSCRGLLSDLKAIRRVFFSHWGENEPFEPYQPVTQTDLIPIVFPEGFELPLVVMIDPLDRMSQYNLVISQRNDPTQPWLQNRNAGDSNPWFTMVTPSCDAHYAIAVKGAEHYPLLFQPKEPLFDQWVSVP